MLSRVQLFATPWTVACQAPLSMGILQARTRVGYHALLQRIFQNRGSNPCLLCLLHWQVGYLLLAPPGKPKYPTTHSNISLSKNYQAKNVSGAAAQKPNFNSRSQRFSFILISKRLIVLCFSFRSMTHFELIFV